MFRRFFRHIYEGFLGIIRHPANTIATVFTTLVSLILVAFFLTLTLNMGYLTKEVETSISLSALVSNSISDSEVLAIKSRIEAVEGVSGVEFRTSDQEFDYYLNQNDDLREFYENYRDDNPFHPTYLITVVSGELMDSVKEKVSLISGIDSVHDGGDNTYKLIDVLYKVRIFGFVLVVCLALLSIYLIYNTIKLSIESRSNEISIMRIVGATKGFIRAPFLAEGVIIGLIGAIITIIMLVIAYLYLYSVTDGYLLGVFTILAPYPFLLYESLIIAGIGVYVGFIGSYLCVTKLLRKVR